MAATLRELRLTAIADFPEVRAGDDLAALIARAVRAGGVHPRDGDVFVVAQKIVSKAEDRYVDLGQVVPSTRAIELAKVTGKDARLVEVVLGESARVVRAVHDVLIVEHRLGFVMANAGVDQSNVGPHGADRVLRLPVDPDASAQRLRDALQQQFGVRIAVVINDSFGRPWRLGTVGVALGAAGLPSLVDLRGTSDRYGRTLRATVVALADELAAAASLLMGQADEGWPVILVQGLAWSQASRSARDLVRPADEDLFR
ncbi:MAG TPA: coenzyme F420-0:L-glutamate ligase [Casimicrobiaceae bacterium]|nr:coenzyme F420-0:L-glutamate ligase [Casimicrobiaceae bacterium]